MKKLFLGLTIAYLTGVAAGQGLLTPPGAVTPTMKTLTELNDALINVSNSTEQVEARIDILTLPPMGGAAHAIHQPGSYYLSENLNVNGSLYEIGIIIYATDVTINLNGFRVHRFNGNDGTGIFVSSGEDSPTIRNGTIRSFSYGIWSQAINTTVENITISDCTSEGFHLVTSAQLINCTATKNGLGISTTDGCVLQHCVAYLNNAGGIQTGNDSVLTECSSYRNSEIGIKTGDGSILNACSAMYNSLSGILTGNGCALNGCSVSNTSPGPGFQMGSANALTDCVSQNNTTYGFKTGQRCLLSRCTAKGNTSRGIEADVNANLSHCVSQDNGAGINAGWGSRVSNCNASKNKSSYGIQVGEGSLLSSCVANANNQQGIKISNACTVTDCTVTENGTSGINIGQKNRVVGNQCCQNKDSGLYVTAGGNRIEKNHLNKNNNGISITVAGNLLVNNSCSGNTNLNYSISGTQTKGPIYGPGTLAIFPLNPWTNFSFK